VGQESNGRRCGSLGAVVGRGVQVAAQRIHRRLLNGRRFVPQKESRLESPRQRFGKRPIGARAGSFLALRSGKCCGHLSNGGRPALAAAGLSWSLCFSRSCVSVGTSPSVWAPISTRVSSDVNDLCKSGGAIVPCSQSTRSQGPEHSCVKTDAAQIRFHHRGHAQPCSGWTGGMIAGRMSLA
jgi:hypothetical protein